MSFQDAQGAVEGTCAFLPFQVCMLPLPLPFLGGKESH